MRRPVLLMRVTYGCRAGGLGVEPPKNLLKLDITAALLVLFFVQDSCPQLAVPVIPQLSAEGSRAKPAIDGLGVEDAAIVSTGVAVLGASCRATPTYPMTSGGQGPKGKGGKLGEQEPRHLCPECPPGRRVEGPQRPHKHEDPILV